jgi:hypothetical protein
MKVSLLHSKLIGNSWNYGNGHRRFPAICLFVQTLCGLKVEGVFHLRDPIV